MAIVTLGSHLAKVRTPRAAVIPYILIEGELFFLLGRDHQSGDITDLGGGVKKHESTLAAALREFNEESDGVLGQLCPNDVTCSVALLSNQMGVLFVPLSKKWYDKAPQLFANRKDPRKKSHSEVDQLIWFAEKDFLEITKPGGRENPHQNKMWKRLRGFYYQGYGDKLRTALHLSYPNLVCK